MSLASCVIGCRVKSGRAIGVVLGGRADCPEPIARVVLELSDPAEAATKQPYHAGFGTERQDRAEIARLAAIVDRCARQSVERLWLDERIRGRTCAAAGFVVGSVIDPERVGNPHIRAHANEGRLFRTVLEDALRAGGVPTTVLVEKTLSAQAEKTLNRTGAAIRRVVAGFGQVLGRPWAADEKAAAIAAWMMLT